MLNILQKNQSPSLGFEKGSILLIDKPLAWTSFDVVNRIRHLLTRHLGTKKLKVGHAGTLDPLATGLLVLCIGDYTKRIDGLQAEQKTYTGTITFGATTPSFDLEKAIDAQYPTAHLHLEMLQLASRQFVGDILQVPPIYSAVKVDGRRLYKNARTGEEVELPHRPIHVASFDLSHFREVSEVRPEQILLSKKGANIWQYPDYAQGVQVDFEVVCSKGTYIRSLAHDLGQAVESGAYLSALRRTASGGFSIAGAWTLEEASEIWSI
jgi:tRNA pseudouridine55 synthase